MSQLLPVALLVVSAALVGGCRPSREPSAEAKPSSAAVVTKTAAPPPSASAVQPGDRESLEAISALRERGLTTVYWPPGEGVYLSGQFDGRAVDFFLAIKDLRGITFDNLSVEGHDRPIGLSRLTGAKALEELSLPSYSGNAWVAEASKLSQVRNLTTGHYVSIEGMRSLGEMTALRELSLAGQGVTDAGLTALDPLTNLESLSLVETGATDAGIAEFKRTHPRVKVHVQIHGAHKRPESWPGGPKSTPHWRREVK
jgi:hypothetical protein